MRVFEVSNRLCNLTPESHPNNVLSFEVGEKKRRGSMIIPSLVKYCHDDISCRICWQAIIKKIHIST